MCVCVYDLLKLALIIIIIDFTIWVMLSLSDRLLRALFHMSEIIQLQQYHIDVTIVLSTHQTCVTTISRTYISVEKLSLRARDIYC